MSRIPRKRPIDYILPFLIMICTGVIVVLGYQLWSTIQGPEDESDIYVYVAQGGAKILPWGAGEWGLAYNGTRLLQEDSIKTQAGGRVVVELFNDHYVRLDERTEVTFSDIKKSGNGYEVNVKLIEGKIWINSNENSQTPIKFTVSTDHTMIKTVSTVYDVEQTSQGETVRVLKGSILADVMIEVDGQVSKVETLNIGVGQQAVLDNVAIEAYTQRQSPSVVDAVSDEFRNSSFYKWNMAEDQTPTDFSLSGGNTDSMTFDGDSTADVGIEEGDLAKPAITVPSTLTFATSESSLTIRGTTVALTQKMMVDVLSDGGSDNYELNLYVPGNTEWSFAVSKAAGTLNPGLNTYRFYALGEGESKSGKTELIINYQSDEVASEEDVMDSEVADTGALKAPEVETYNGKESNVVETDTVKVVGSVVGAKEINVSGYTLSAFEPGDTSWTYYAKESLGNLDPGENTFTVTATAEDGTKKSTNFTITYNKTETVADDDSTVDPGV
jgi:hypothetical protein